MLRSCRKARFDSAIRGRRPCCVLARPIDFAWTEVGEKDRCEVAFGGFHNAQPWLKRPAVFHPEREIQFGVAVLPGIDAVVALGDDPFPEVRANADEFYIGGLEPLPEQQFGCPIAALSKAVRRASQ